MPTRKTLEQKALAGTARPDRGPARAARPNPLRDRCPASLPEEGAALWRRLRPRLARLGLASELDAAALELACGAYALARQALARLQADGLFIADRTHGGELRKHPALAIWTANIAAFKGYAAMLGLDPKNRQSIEPMVGDEEPSEFEIYMELKGVKNSDA